MKKVASRNVQGPITQSKPCRNKGKGGAFSFWSGRFTANCEQNRQNLADLCQTSLEASFSWNVFFSEWFSFAGCQGSEEEAALEA